MPRIRNRGATVEEIELLYKARLAEYHRVARAILNDSESARDAVQDAFACALRTRRSFRGEGSLDAWVWRAVTNAALSQVRRRPPQVPPVPSQNGSVQAHDPDVRLALARLPERQRAAVFLRYYADLDYATIASVLGVAEGTVAATLHTAHRAFRLHYEEVRS